MADELSIKDVITLFNNELRTEAQLKEKLSSSSKEALVDYIMADLLEGMNDDDDLDLTEDSDDRSNELEY